ncbi:MAG: 4Fe-4S binding protein [Desulfobacterales bacterium]
MADNVYKRLREFLDRLPAGFPETPDGVEIKLLKKMFTPEQAELVMNLTSTPETVAEIASRTGMDERRLAEQLEQMCKDGLIFRVREGDTPKYQAFQFLIGLYEFQVNRLDREFCELFEAYMPHIGLSMASLPKQLRVVPVESSLAGYPEVAPYNRIREMVDKEEVISVTDCICKKEQGILGNPCSKPMEVCIMFGDWARFYVENGNARQIDGAEADKILDLAEENGLVLQIGNSQDMLAICCCCACCCPGLKNIKLFPNPGELVMSYYRSVIDGELCTGCGECIEICPMDAIEDKDGISLVSDPRCIGCGLCVNRCPVEAIALVERGDKTDAPPRTFQDLTDSIAAQRGVQP